MMRILLVTIWILALGIHGFLLPSGGRSMYAMSSRRRVAVLRAADPGINTLGGEMTWEEGLQMLQENPEASLQQYNTVIRACAKAGQWAASCWLVDEIVEVGLMPDAVTYTYAIESCGKDGRHEEARHLLDCMKDAEYTIGVDVYQSVLHACQASSQWRQMMWTFDEMMIRKLVPPLSIYNSAIKGCGQEGEWEMALSLLREADQRGLIVDKTSYTHAIEACISAKQASEAVKVVQAMTDDGHQPAEPLYLSVIQLCEAQGVDITPLRTPPRL